MGFLARWRWRKLGYGRRGMSCLLLPDSSSDHCNTPSFSLRVRYQVVN